jgi:hypothetical protein
VHFQVLLLLYKAQQKTAIQVCFKLLLNIIYTVGHQMLMCIIRYYENEHDVTKQASYFI